MKIFDTFLFFNELELLDIRLHTLNDHVDYFVLSEATKTFSGQPKPLYYEENKTAFKRFEGKIIHNIVDDTPDDFTKWTPPNPYYTNRNKSYPHKHNGIALKELHISCQREVFQRDSVIIPLLHFAQPEDIILSSDIDELPNPGSLKKLIHSIEDDCLYHFSQKWYLYFFNNLCHNEWFGTRACKIGYLEGKSIDLIRYSTEIKSAQYGKIIDNGGWHFSYLGGSEMIKKKLDAIAYQGKLASIGNFMNLLFKNRLANAIEKNTDILFKGRKFSRVEIDDTFPSYLVVNNDRFKDFIKQ